MAFSSDGSVVLHVIRLQYSSINITCPKCKTEGGVGGVGSIPQEELGQERYYECSKCEDTIRYVVDLTVRRA